MHHSQHAEPSVLLRTYKQNCWRKSKRSKRETPKRDRNAALNALNVWNLRYFDTYQTPAGESDGNDASKSSIFDGPSTSGKNSSTVSARNKKSGADDLSLG